MNALARFGGWATFLASFFALVFFAGDPFHRLRPDLWRNLFVEIVSKVPTGLLPTAGRFSLAVLAAAAVVAAGVRLSLRLGGRGAFRDRLETLLVGGGLGAGALGFAVLGVGAIGFWNAAPLWILVAGLWGLRPEFLRIWRELPWLGERREFSALDKTLLGLMLFLGLANAAATGAPEIFFDALLYHLGLPSFYALEGRILATPEILHAGFPALGPMIFGSVLGWLGESGPHAVNLFFTFGTAALLWKICQAVEEPDAGLLAAALWLSIPLASILIWKTSAEPGWVFFLTLSIWSGLRFEGESRSRFSAIFAGLAAGMKYLAWPQVVLIGVWIAWREPERGRAFRKWAAWAAALAAVWPLRNLFFYGNPIYPFFHDVLYADSIGVDWRTMAAVGGRDWAGYFDGIESTLRFLAHPWFELSRRAADVDAIGPVALFGLFPLLFFAGSEKARSLRILAAGFWLIWLLSSSMTRFFLPAAAMVSLWTAIFLGRFSKERWKWGAWVVVAIALLNLNKIVLWFWAYGLAAPVFSGQRASEFLSKPTPSYGQPVEPAFRFLATLPKDSKALFLGEARGHRSPIRFRTASQFGHHPLRAWMRESRDARALRDRFDREGITHLVVNVPELKRLHDGGQSRFDWAEPEIALWREFWERNVRRIFAHQKIEGRSKRGEGRIVWAEVYSLLPARYLGVGPAPENTVLQALSYESFEAK